MNEPVTIRRPADAHVGQPDIEEELAGPVLRRQMGNSERIPMLDVIRGFALLGILLSNIVGFSGPVGLDENPTLVGNHYTWNVAAWVVHTLFIEGKMRAVFCMLFGASVILLTDRLEARGMGARVGDIFVRRNLWLMIIGMAHAYLLWFGDILYRYGLTALLFLYPFRRAGPKLLFGAGMAALALLQIQMGFPALREWSQQTRLEAAVASRAAGRTLTAGEHEALAADSRAKEENARQRVEDLRHMRGGYVEIVKYHAKAVRSLESDGLYPLGFADSLGMMLIGMGLLRIGFLDGRLPDRFYLWTMAIGYPIAIAGSGLIAAKVIEAGFTTMAVHVYWNSSYQVLRLVGTMPTLALVILICKRGWLGPVSRGLAAVGKMALSNYVLMSLVCALFFDGHGSERYGRLEYFELIFVVLAVWALILVVSPLWLRSFAYGPLEWMWRSLTYWRVQPMRLVPAGVGVERPWPLP